MATPVATAAGSANSSSSPRTELRSELAAAMETLDDDREQSLLSQQPTSTSLWPSTSSPTANSWPEMPPRPSGSSSAPRLRRFEAMAATAESLASYETEEATSADESFDARDDARRTLITVALGAGIVICAAGHGKRRGPDGARGGAQRAGKATAKEA